jgi:hypothetical protein
LSVLSLTFAHRDFSFSSIQATIVDPAALTESAEVDGTDKSDKELVYKTLSFEEMAGVEGVQASSFAQDVNLFTITERPSIART